MPEFPEVYLTARAISRKIQGQKLRRLLINNHAAHENLLGHHPRVGNVGKILYFEFPDGYLIVHHKLNGKWQGPDDDPRKAKLVMEFDKTTLYYQELMNIGYVKFVKELPDAPPDPLHISIDEFMEALSSHRQIYSIITDQKKIAGIGNYLAAEILYDAGINPKTIKLDDHTKHILYKSMKKIVKKSIADHGSPNYKIFGKVGKYKFRCYEIGKKTKIGSRTVYY
jgi:formamidopyrimidine-DNA glycosylase